MSPLLARAFGPAGRGAYAAITAPFILLGIIGTLGAQDAVAYFLAARRLSARGAVNLVTRWTVRASAIALCAAAGVGPMLFRGHGGLMLDFFWLCLAFLPLNIAFNAYYGILTGIGDTRGLTFARLLPTALRTGGIALLFFAFGGFSPFAAGTILAGSSAITTIWLVRRCRGSNADKEGTEVQPPEFRRMSLAAFPGVLATVSSARLDQVIGLPLIGAKQLGLYAVAVSVAELPMVVGTAARVAILGVRHSRTARDEQVRVAFSSVALVALACALLAGVAWRVIPAVFGHAFAGAVSPALILLFGTVLYAAGSSASAILVSRGEAARQSVALVAGAVVGVAALAVFRSHGASGAAAASVIGYACTLGFCIAGLCVGPKGVPQDLS